MKDYYLKKLTKQILYWEKRRKNRIKFAFYKTNSLVIPFFIMMAAFEGFNNLITINYGLKLLIFYFISFTHTFFISYKIQEKNYHKLKKEIRGFDI